MPPGTVFQDASTPYCRGLVYVRGDVLGEPSKRGLVLMELFEADTGARHVDPIHLNDFFKLIELQSPSNEDQN